MPRLSETDHNIIMFLATKGPSVADDIAKGVGAVKLTVYRRLKRLRRGGYADRRETPQEGTGRAPYEWFLVQKTQPKPPAHVGALAITEDV